MTNDTSTLNGALAELGETMATNITAKGVSASASDGLTTLAGKISQISQSGGGTPVVEFDNTNFGTRFAFTRPSGSFKDTFTIHVPSGTTHLVEYCFYYLKNLTGIDLPTGLTNIGQYAFYYCEGLTEVEIPNTVAAIGQNAFYYCTSLQSVNIPTSLSSIPTNCFRYSGLTSVTIPSNITSMSSYAFGNCSNLETIHFDSATPPTASSNAFYNLPTTCVIEVPCDSLSLYTSASNYPSSSTYTYVPYGCNGLKFLQNSYTTTTGSCELSLKLWDNNVPVSGGIITITGSDSSSYTCTTDSNGEATCTVTNVTGTVTFTATYGNYSDTATVTVQSYPYQQVEYLQSNGSQYINTGYKLKANDKVEVRVSMQGSGTYNGVFGARKNDYQHNAYALFGRFGSQNKFVYTRTGQEKSGDTISTNVIYDVTTQGSTCTIMQGDTLVQTLTTTGTVEDCVNPCGLFVLNTYNGADGFNKDTYGYMKIYSFKITDSNNNVVMDLIPVRDGTTGYMYDKVTGNLMTKSGTFLYGADI